MKRRRRKLIRAAAARGLAAAIQIAGRSLRDVTLLGGLAAMTIGIWQLSAPMAMIVGGGLVFAISLYSLVRDDHDRREALRPWRNKQPK